MTLDDIRVCLEKDGWPIEALSPSTMRSRFRGTERIFRLLVHLEDSFVTLAVIPFTRLPDDPGIADDLMRRLLRLNREINLAKFSVDEDGDVILSVEYRLEHLDPSEVRDAVDVLSFYADRHFAEIDRLVRAGNAEH
jgi:hypothetical protein